MALVTFSQQLAEWNKLNLMNCIGVDECMKVCPVVDPDLTIAELNEASKPGAALTEATLKFAADCVQCGRCDTICPTIAGRSIMMLGLKEEMASSGRSPKSHKKYFALKGFDKSPVRRAAFNTFIKAKWRFSEADKPKYDKLASHIDKDDFKKSEYLFYFGCYIFTKEESALQCLDIADTLRIDYEVLGGLKSCCGWPSLLAGRTGEAEDYHEHLKNLIEKSDPKYVITGCAECFMSLNKVKAKYEMKFEALSTPMWLNMFKDRLDIEKSGDPVTFHDSCNISRKLGMPEPARELLDLLSPSYEMERSGRDDTYCCGYWGLGADPEILKKMHQSRFDEALATGAGTMVVECITCLESFSQSAGGSGLKIVDIVGLVHDRMRRR